MRRFYVPVIRTVPRRDLRYLEEFMVLAREDDILARNPHARLPGGIASFSEHQRALETLRNKVGPERFAVIEQAASDLWQLNVEQVLRPWLDEGIISREMYREMWTTHPHYIPFQRADFTETIHQSFSARPEANLSTTGIKKMGLEGSERTLSDPLNRLLQEPIKAKTVIFRNRAARSIVQALEEMQRQTGEDLVRYIEPKGEMRIAYRVTGEALPRVKKGEISQIWETISYFEDGVKHRVEVPSIYGRIAKGLEAEPDNLALQIIRVFNAPLRYGATTFNPLFMPVNIIRDAMSAMFREKLFPFGPDYMAGLWAVIRKNATYQEAAQSGALLSGIVENMNPSRFRVKAGGVSRFGAITAPAEALWKGIAAPFRLIEQANIIAERGVRVATFKKLRAEGLDALEAAVRSRDSTVDFAKSGHAMRVINQVIPFTNASVQGGANLVRTLRDHPARSTAFAAMFTGGVVAARVNNMRFETSEMIPDYEYTRNYVIQFGEGTRKDGTKYPIYVKIPKGEIAAMLTFPAEALLHLARKSEDRSVTELLLSQGFEALRTISPVEIGGVTGILPPMLETGVGVQTGIDPFTGGPLIPQREEGLAPEQQFGKETSATAVELGQLFHVSPRVIDFVLKDIAAGVGQQVNWLMSMGLEALGINPTPLGAERPDAKLQPSGAEAISQTPLSRFVGTRGTQLERRSWDRIRETELRWRRAWIEDVRAYYNLPTETRTDYREDNPDVDAKLFITGQVSSLQTRRAVNEAVKLIKESGIDPDSIKAIKGRKDDLAQAQKAGKRLERNEVDRLIAMLESGVAVPAQPSQPSAPSEWQRFIQPQATPQARQATPTPNQWQRFMEPAGVGR